MSGNVYVNRGLTKTRETGFHRFSHFEFHNLSRIQKTFGFLVFSRGYCIKVARNTLKKCFFRIDRGSDVLERLLVPENVLIYPENH